MQRVLPGPAEAEPQGCQKLSRPLAQKALGTGAQELSSGLRLQGSIPLFPADDTTAFLWPLTHVAFICFISRHEYTHWKLCLIAKLKTFGFPFLLDSLLVCCILSWVGFLGGGGFFFFFFSKPPSLTEQREASGFLANWLRPVLYIWAISLPGGAIGSCSPLVVVVKQHLPASFFAQLLPVSGRELACLTIGRAVGSPKGCCFLELRDSWLGPSEWSLQSRGELLRLGPRTLGEQTGPAAWGWDLDEPAPGRAWDGKWPLEAGQPHLVGIGFDMCF